MRSIENRKASVYFDKKRKKYRAQIYIKDYDTGKYNKRVKSFDTEEEANKYIASIMWQQENPLFIKNNGIPLSQLMRANAKKKLDSNLISENQYGRIIKTIRVIEKSPIAHKKIEDLTSEEIQGYLNTKKHYSNSYIKKIYEQFNQVYRYAMNKEYIYKNPMNDVIKPISDKMDKEVRALTIEEQQAFTNYLLNTTLEECPYRNLFLIQLYMGTRVGEALALRNTDIDLQHNIVKISKTLTTNGEDKVVMNFRTKTASGKRELPIPPFLRPYIIEQMRISNDNKDGQLFLSLNGKYVDNRNVNRILKKILKEKFNITDISNHSLRHSYRY